MPTKCDCGCNESYLQVFWVLINEETQLPISICSGYYPGDKPMPCNDGKWIRVVEALEQEGGAVWVKENNEDNKNK